MKQTTIAGGTQAPARTGRLNEALRESFMFWFYYYYDLFSIFISLAHRELKREVLELSTCHVRFCRSPRDN